MSISKKEFEAYIKSRYKFVIEGSKAIITSKKGVSHTLEWDKVVYYLNSSSVTSHANKWRVQKSISKYLGRDVKIHHKGVIGRSK